MCLIALAWQYSSRFPVVLAANRDELYSRPAEAAGWWPQARVLGGVDRAAGGTWLALSERGRWGAVTNVRRGGAREPGLRSRGDLVRDFVLGAAAVDAYVRDVARQRDDYAPFNLLVADRDRACYVSSERARPQELAPGIYGLSNGVLDEPWPKVTALKGELETALDGEDVIEPLLEALGRTTQPSDAELPDTGVGLHLERALAPAFIRTPLYGTRASTVVVIDSSGMARFVEHRFGPDGASLGRSHLETRLTD